MPSLLCTLGTSWAVVPEAFLLGNGTPGYESVHVITTSSDATREAIQQVTQWFAVYAPHTVLRMLPIEHLADLTDTRDHQVFEQAFLQVYFSILAQTSDIHVCLAGGFKTMSATAQEIAGLLGCSELFHIIAPFGLRTETDPEIRAAIAEGKVRKIPLGSRTAWPTILELAADAPPLPARGEPFLVEDFSLSNAVQHRVEAANRLAASEPELANLPFPQLARWSPSERAALHAPLGDDPSGADHAWLLALPKIELHCHLGGFATHGEMLSLIRAAAANPVSLPPLNEPPLPKEWPLPPNPTGLEHYTPLGDANGSKLLKDPGCLKKQCELLFHHLRSQSITYAEIRCSPNNYISTGRSAWDVIGDIRQTFQDCQQKFPDGPHINLIIIATRRDGGDRSDISRHLALAITAAQHWQEGCRVVGVDLAGFENKDTRAALFTTDFEPVHRVGLAVTVHAGENDDAEGIWQAVFKLNARRLGHALRLIDAPDLLRAVAERRICVEMCPYANYQIKGFKPMPGSEHGYPLLRYLEAGVPVTVNTDNIGISAASLTDNFLLLPRLCPGITRLHILQLIRNSIDQAFIPSDLRKTLIAKHIPKAEDRRQKTWRQKNGNK